ncbi:hypothetical protein JHD50_07420 [Sulfurimonas sp. MAG313]|nr:hypothetical protein [Sulfurimonas sp. MAG313]MDF1881133.1 hypothetical protein [Sulfurimonas sp. MAG313]
MQDIPLHDIKPLVEVPDNSLMVLIIIASVLLSLILIALGLWAWKKFTKTKKINLKKKYLKKMHAINTQNAKQAAYEISEYARFLVSSPEEIALLERLDEGLAQYKYKKTVEALDAQMLKQFKEFLEVIDAT